MSAWIQGHLWQTTVVLALYLVLSVLWRLFKYLRRKHAERRARGRPRS